MSEMILQDKPIPAVLARSVYGADSGGFSNNIPVTAIVERNVYSEEGRNIIIPAGLMSRIVSEIRKFGLCLGGRRQLRDRRSYDIIKRKKAGNA